jgi:hypothetical protein
MLYSIEQSAQDARAHDIEFAPKLGLRSPLRFEDWRQRKKDGAVGQIRLADYILGPLSKPLGVRLETAPSRHRFVGLGLWAFCKTAPNAPFPSSGGRPRENRKAPQCVGRRFPVFRTGNSITENRELDHREQGTFPGYQND